MLRIFLLSSFLILSACASINAPPMKSGEINSIKSGKAAVMFYDIAGRITYMEDTFMLLAVTTSTTHATYKGFLDINKEMSTFHANNLKSYGVNAESAYKIFSKSEAKYLDTKQAAMFTRYDVAYDDDSKAKKNSKLVDADLRNQLIKKGYDYLVWVPFRGYSLHLPTLGLNPLESINMSYVLYDLKKEKMMWTGGFSTRNSIDIKGATGKDFLEKDSLKGYKNRLKTLTRTFYKDEDNSVIGTSIGFVSSTL